MNKVIFPEVVPDVAVLKDVLIRELPPGCKIKMAPFNRKGMRVVKSFFVATDVLVRKDRIILTNPVLMLMGVYVLICLPFAIYAMLKLCKPKGQTYTFDRFSPSSIRFSISFNFLSFSITCPNRLLACVTPDSDNLNNLPISISFAPL